MEKPEVVKIHLRDMIILPEMVHSMVGLYNGKTFNQMEIKQATTCSSSPIPTSLEIQVAISATDSCFIPLKYLRQIKTRV